MHSTAYTCESPALATVLQNIGINATERDLKVLAGTDKTGTSMYGLARAAHAKGLDAVGMRLSIDDLRTNHIVHVTIDGEGHYSVVREITETSVYLADPSKGNIVMTREEFSAIFTGNVLVINGFLNQTETTNQTNITAPVSVQSENQTLTAEEMHTVRGRVIKVLGVKLLALKVAITSAVKKIPLTELRRMGFRELVRHINERIPWWLRWFGPIAAHAARGIMDYRERTPAHRRTHWGYAWAAVGGAIWRLI